MVFQTFAGPTRRAENMYQACPRRLVLLNSIATFASCKHGQGERGQWGRRVGGRESDPETNSVGTGLVRKCIYLESGVTCSDVRPATTIEQGYMVRRSKVSLRVAKKALTVRSKRIYGVACVRGGNGNANLLGEVMGQNTDPKIQVHGVQHCERSHSMLIRFGCVAIGPR